MPRTTSPKLKKQQQPWARRLELLRGVINDQEKADVLLVWARWKPATLVELFYRTSSRTSKRKFLEKVRGFTEILEQLSLRHDLRINYPTRRSVITHYSVVARSEKILARVRAALATRNDRERRLRIGRAIGYPETAVRGFANKQVIHQKNLPRSVRRSTEFRFLTFRLSRHWQEEWAYIEERAAMIKKVAPYLFKRIARGKFLEKQAHN